MPITNTCGGARIKYKTSLQQILSISTEKSATLCLLLYLLCKRPLPLSS
jgi:hypothetical protein